MKVFIVLGCMDYEPTDVLAVFSTKEKADSFKLEKLEDRNNSYNEIKILDWNVDH